MSVPILTTEKPIGLPFTPKLLIVLIGLVFGVLVALFPIWTAVVILGILVSIFVFEKYRWGILALIFFLPFQKLLTMEIRGYTLQISYFLAIVTFFSWVVFMIVRREAKLVRTPLDAPLAIFLLVNLLSMVNAINVSRSIAVFSWALLSVLLYYLLVNLVRDTEMLMKVVRVLIISGTLVAAFGIYQFIASYLGWPAFLGEYYRPHVGYMARIRSTTLEPLIFASYLMVVIPVTFSLHRMKHSPIKGSFLLTGFVLMCSALILTISRGGYISFVVAMGAIFLLSKRHLIKKKNRIQILAMLVIIGGIIIFLIAVIAPSGSVSMTIYQGARSRAMSIAERMIALDRAINFFRESPLLGIGIGNFGPYSNMGANRSIYDVNSFEVVNNVPAEVLAETGILGFLSLLWLGFSYLKTMWQAITTTDDSLLFALGVGFTASFVALSFQYLTFSPFYAVWTWSLLGMSMVVAGLARKRMETH